MGVLHSRGYTEYAAGVQERRIALRAIGAHPVAFAKDSVNHFGDYATTAAGGMTDTSVRWITPAYTHVIASAPPIVRRSLGRVSWRVLRSASLLSTLWWILSGFGLTGVL